MRCPRCQADAPDSATYCPRCQNLLPKAGGDTTAVHADMTNAGKAPEPAPRENIESRFVLASLFRRYWDFSGRSSRREFWLAFALWWGVILFSYVVGIIVAYAVHEDLGAWLFISIVLLYTVATLIPGLAVLVRRFHDTGYSGNIAWLFFTGICAPWGIYVLCCPSQPEANACGKPPVLQSSSPSAK